MDTPQPPAPKKGISGLAIAGIGCGGLVVLALIAAFVLAGKACSKFNEVAGDFQKNPAKAAAMLALKFNPEVEVVSTDDTKNEITIRTKKDGKTMTMSFEDVANGKFTMTDAEGKTVTIDGSNAAKGGGIVMKGPDGETVIGGASSNPPPAWVPTYPGMTSQHGGLRTEQEGKVNGMSLAESADPVAKVKEFYELKLKEAGFKTEARTASVNGSESASVSGTKENPAQSVTVIITGNAGKTSVAIQYEGAK